jgi:hypothetical protein
MATLRVPGYSGTITTPHGSVEVVNGEAAINIDRKAADADIKPLSADADDRARAAHARRVAEREDARRTVRMVEHFIARGYSVAGADTDPAPVSGRRRRDTASGQPRGAAASRDQAGVAEEIGPVSTAVSEEGDGPSADELAKQVASRQEARGT